MEKFEQEKEQELYTTKIDFFTNVAHEIRTPLTLIKCPLENVLADRGTLRKCKDGIGNYGSERGEVTEPDKPIT